MLHARIAFLTSRTDYLHAKDHRKNEKGREINPRRLPPGTEDLFLKAREKEWAKHLEYDVFEVLPDLDSKKLRAEGKNVLTLRYVLTDKNEHQRGDKSYKEVPVIPKARLVTPGYQDLDNLQGRLKKDAPTLPQEAMGLIFQLAASKAWELHQGDVESAF